MVTYSRRSLLQGLVGFSISLGATRLIDPFLVVAFAQTGGPRPFEMLVLGDSVVWGQGLIEDKKFYTLLKNAIEQHLTAGRKVRPLVKAHSGAAIEPKKPKPCPFAPGEVPIATPTLFAQVDAALSEYASFGVNREDVDLILLNGGINDVGFPRIVNPFTSEKTLTKQSEKFCKDGMQKLLERVRERFPRAVILVTGFFPIISLETDPDFLRKLIQAFFGGSESRKILEKAAKEQQKELKEAARLGRAESQPDWLIRRLALLSSHWKTVSDADLQSAVNAVNIGAARVYFVKVDFLPEECYATGERTNFWKITGSSGGTGNIMTDDDMFVPRQETCRLAASELDSFGRLICPVAGTGHPNDKGAQKYAEALIQKLRETSILRRL